MSQEDAQAFWVTGPGAGELRRQPVAEPGPADVEIRTLYSAISRGTEALVYSGKVPPSEYECMRAPFQEGAFPAPVKYGYISVGRVTRGSGDYLGRTVFCLYPHQTRYVVPADSVTVVPEDVPAERAVLAANLETAVNGVWDGAPRSGDRVAVVGAGTVGCLIAWLVAGQRGTSVELVDIDPRKADAASALGVSFRLPDQASADADLVFHASGAAEGLKLALGLAGFESRVVEMSWFGAEPVALPLGESFHSKRLSLVSSQVAHVAGSQRARWDHARRMRLVMRLLASTELDSLITGESPFESLPEVMQRLAANADGSLCHRIAYR
jgi:2-desacetyl-2-hydroxyethyl bacteriochlorophyllide A dehydrogenase